MRTISTKLALVLPAIAIGTIAQADDLYVAGPVGLTTQDGKQISILGQTLDVQAATSFFMGGKRVAAQRFFRHIEAGSFVYAEAVDHSGKLEATKLLLVNNQYVPGATVVFLSGKVSTYDELNGRVRVGSLDLDVTNAPPSLLASLSADDLVEAVGIQPSAQLSLVLASEIKISRDAQSTGTSGSGVSAQGISGSGVSKQGISGSGVSAQGISGSGVSAQGISGSGVSKQGISGSGVSAQGISGSGVSAQGISGSGVSKQGISGSGVSAQGISGSGKSIQGISGSGISAQGISGSG